MSWFSFYSTMNSAGTIISASPVEKYPPVRRKILFYTLSENIKVGDWLYVPLGDVEVGRSYSYNSGIVTSVADSSSYLVVYENGTSYQPTYAYIDSNNNLYFKSVTNVTSGSALTGSYYVYYHYKNIQHLAYVSSQYIQSEISINGFEASEDGSTSIAGTIDKYSNLVLGTSANDRINSISYISSPGSWSNQESDGIGNKVIANFDGPLIKIYGRKSPDSGKVSVKIIKTSSSGLGQSVISKDEVDLFSPTIMEDVVVYEKNISQTMTTGTVEELYGSFMFEIEILAAKNIVSTGNKAKITKYAFSKNHQLEIDSEEIYEGIVFTSSGVIR